MKRIGNLIISAGVATFLLVGGIKYGPALYNVFFGNDEDFAKSLPPNPTVSATVLPTPELVSVKGNEDGSVELKHEFPEGYNYNQNTGNSEDFAKSYTPDSTVSATVLPTPELVSVKENKDGSVEFKHEFPEGYINDLNTDLLQAKINELLLKNVATYAELEGLVKLYEEYKEFLNGTQSLLEENVEPSVVTEGPALTHRP